MNTVKFLVVVFVHICAFVLVAFAFQQCVYTNDAEDLLKSTHNCVVAVCDAWGPQITICECAKESAPMPVYYTCDYFGNFCEEN